MSGDGVSKNALRTALLAWGFLTVAIGVVFLFFDHFVDNVLASLALTSLSSAAFSIAGALLITEWVIKPLYVRDMIDVARLSAEIHRAGLDSLRSSNKTDWSRFFSGGGGISIAIGNESIFRSGPWPTLMECSRTGSREVLLHIAPALVSNDFANSIEASWRSNECGANGSTLSVVPHTEITQGMIAHCNQWIAVSAADDPHNDDPILLVFRTDVGEALAASLHRGIRRLNDSSTPPLAGA